MTTPLTAEEIVEYRRRGTGCISKAEEGGILVYPVVEGEILLRLLDEVEGWRSLALSTMEDIVVNGTAPSAVPPKGLLRYLDDLERARALLGRIEWGLLRDERPACGGPMQHRPDYELAAPIGGTS